MAPQIRPQLVYLPRVDGIRLRVAEFQTSSDRPLKTQGSVGLEERVEGSVPSWLVNLIEMKSGSQVEGQHYLEQHAS